MVILLNFVLDLLFRCIFYAMERNDIREQEPFYFKVYVHHCQ